VLAPVAEQLADKAFKGLVLVVPVRVQRDIGRVEIRNLGDVFRELAVTEAGAMVLVDVPVDLARIFLGIRTELVGTSQRSGIKSPCVLRNGLDLRNVCIRDDATTVWRIDDVCTRRV